MTWSQSVEDGESVCFVFMMNRGKYACSVPSRQPSSGRTPVLSVLLSQAIWL